MGQSGCKATQGLVPTLFLSHCRPESGECHSREYQQIFGALEGCGKDVKSGRPVAGLQVSGCGQYHAVLLRQALWRYRFARFQASPDRGP